MGRLPFQNQVLCPVCGTGRDTPQFQMPWGRVSLLTVAWALLAGTAVGLWLGMVAGWWGALLGGVLSFLVSEVYYTVKFKRELVCPICQFDPVLYRRAPEEAKTRCLESLKMKEEVFLAKWRALKQQANPLEGRDT